MCQLCQEAEESEMCHCTAGENENAGNCKPKVTHDWFSLWHSICNFS